MKPRGFQDQNAGLDPSWLVAAEGSKKINRHCQIFCPLRPIWALISSIIYYMVKAHRKREWRVKYITNITPNWSPAFTFMCLLPDEGKRGTRQPKNRPRVFNRLSHSNCGNQHITCIWSWTILILVGDIINPSFLTFQWLSKVLEPRLDSFPMLNGRISARFPHLECYLPSPDVSRVGLYKRQNLRPKNLPPFLSPFLDMK